LNAVMEEKVQNGWEGADPKGSLLRRRPCLCPKQLLEKEKRDVEIARKGRGKFDTGNR